MLVRQSPNQSLRRWLYVLQSVVCDEIGRLHTIAIATRTQLIASSTQADGHNIIRLASLIYSCLHSLVHFSLVVHRSNRSAFNEYAQYLCFMRRRKHLRECDMQAFRSSKRILFKSDACAFS